MAALGCEYQSQKDSASNKTFISEKIKTVIPW